ncbi:hypothetical protein J4G43_025690 [Bradyrhizobium barranii subsp. barranii]|uniref:Uncharacterized protein n=1 Tax=Bradyrhizobium barranii subsp. barranii TaxID=2823807 RepID=A0A9X9YBN2_9BRAD|nr:hypothetical protein [Bradyrhizobium barranii]UEM17326.1 hypothetical protein J4G43_025690 [Bradyrhizobium barranii subsp. barranii]
MRLVEADAPAPRFRPRKARQIAAQALAPGVKAAIVKAMDENVSDDEARAAFAGVLAHVADNLERSAIALERPVTPNDVELKGQGRSKIAKLLLLRPAPLSFAGFFHYGRQFRPVGRSDPCQSRRAWSAASHADRAKPESRQHVSRDGLEQ